jgi:hypothetical protein
LRSPTRGEKSLHVPTPRGWDESLNPSSSSGVFGANLVFTGEPLPSRFTLYSCLRSNLGAGRIVGCADPSTRHTDPFAVPDLAGSFVRVGDVGDAVAVGAPGGCWCALGSNSSGDYCCRLRRSNCGRSRRSNNLTAAI